MSCGIRYTGYKRSDSFRQTPTSSRPNVAPTAYGMHRGDRPVKRGERQRTQRKDLIGYASSPIAALYACRDPLREAVDCAALTGAADGQEGEGAAGCVEGQVARIKLAAGDEGLAPLVG